MFLNILKTKIKRSPHATRLYERIFQPPIRNVFRTTNGKRALLSYSTYHFKNLGYRAHSNYQESVTIAEILRDMGYDVDVDNNNRETVLDLRSYDLIIGEGLPMFEAAQLQTRGRLIYYATGSHPWQCTEASLLRLCEHFRKHRQFLMGSTRVQDARWGIAANLADGVICIGNDETRETFYRFGCKDVRLVAPTFHPSERPNPWKSRELVERSRRTALWFGSYGLLHKGLDIAIDAFAQRPDWTLHICGYTDREPELTRLASLPPNVKDHGFMNIESDAFQKIMDESCYVVLPSCSEGIATSVVTAMGRGGLIPVVTCQSGVNLDDFGISIAGLSPADLGAALNQCDSLSADELARRSSRAYNTAAEGYSFANYKSTMQRLLHELA